MTTFKYTGTFEDYTNTTGESKIDFEIEDDGNSCTITFFDLAGENRIYPIGSWVYKALKQHFKAIE